jgi:hypothetical protein
VTLSSSRNAQLRSLEYGETEHRLNPYIDDDLTAHTNFRRENGDAIANFFEREAKTPVTVPWTGPQRNITLMMSMEKQNPALRNLVDRSIETAKAWAADQMEEAEKQAGEALARQQAARTLLETKS